MSKFALFVGNGFTHDLASQLDLHSSSPLQNFKNKDINYNDFIDKLPTVKRELFGQQVNDFDAIKSYVSKYQYNDAKACELRRFLTMSYSAFQNSVESYKHQMINWKWTRWLRDNKNGLKLAISFNYDLILEKALSITNISYRRIGTNDPLGRIPILKPHGSIDFDLPDFSISCPIEMRWGITTTLNDAQFVKVIPKSDWLLPRMEADIIPPSMFNIQLNLSWVNEMFNFYTIQSGKLDAFIIIGSSYWDVDQPEIDFYLQKLNKEAVVYIMNPRPNPELIRTLESLGLYFKLFNFEDVPW